MICVYCFYNLVSENFYIGSTVDFKRRIGQHLSKRGPRSAEVRKKISLKTIGKTRSEETKNKLSLLRREKPPLHTSPHSEATKQKLREINLGKTLSEETCDKIGKRTANSVWVNDGNTNRFISKSLLSQFLASGFSLGMTKKRGVCH